MLNGTTPQCSITPADQSALEQGSWIDQLIVECWGLRRVDTIEGATLVGQEPREDYAGIVFPTYWPGNPTPREYYLRRDHPPMENGKPKGKYLAPLGRGNRLLFGPGESVESLTDTAIPIIFVEGLKKLLATYRLARHDSEQPRFLPCAVTGVWNWRGTIGKAMDAGGRRVDEKGVIPDFERITWAGRNVVIVFDSDCLANGSVGAARRGLVAELKRRRARVGVVDLPALDDLPKTGFDDFLAKRGPKEALKLIEAARVGAPLAERASSGFAPTTLDRLLDEPESLEPDWILEDLIPAGALGCLVAKPKVGKSTIAYELAANVSQGRPFLGRTTKQGPVLILAMEEHRREIKRRLRNLLGTEQLNTIHLHIGPLTDSPDTLHALSTYITQHNVVLVIFDTLNTFWSVTDENDAGPVTQVIKPLLELARGTGAGVLLLHHARKSEGANGDEIRGSGALFSLLDVALSLKRHEVETQRRLVVTSRYPESPPELILELREHGYVSLGDPAASSKAAKLSKLADALTDTPMEAKDLAVSAGLPVKATYTLLDLLFQQGKVLRAGAGKRGDPFLFSKCVSVSIPKGGGPGETNSGGLLDKAEAHPSNGKYVSSPPPTPRGGGKETHCGVGDSFLLGGTGGERNEMEEVIDL